MKMREIWGFWDTADNRKMADGLFLSTARDIAKDYPDITFDAELLDNTCLRIVTDPTPYNDRVMVMPNLYGDILSDLSAGYPPPNLNSPFLSLSIFVAC